MVKRDGAETRKERISQIARDLHSAFFCEKERGEKAELDLSKFLGTEMFRTGLTKERVKEYLEVLETMNQCEIDTVANKIRKPSGV